MEVYGYLVAHGAQVLELVLASVYDHSEAIFRGFDVADLAIVLL
jgi:hypothetical protein